jgi:hypothetical protein
MIMAMAKGIGIGERRSSFMCIFKVKPQDFLIGRMILILLV